MNTAVGREPTAGSRLLLAPDAGESPPAVGPVVCVAMDVSFERRCEAEGGDGPPASNGVDGATTQQRWPAGGKSRAAVAVLIEHVRVAWGQGQDPPQSTHSTASRISPRDVWR